MRDDPAFDALFFLRRAYASARSRAKGSGLSFDLTFAFIQRMLDHQEGRCAVSGIAFHAQRFETAFVKFPFAPSIDRKDCAEGYVGGNVRLVCTAVNFGLGQWGDEVFHAIARATLAKQPPLSTLSENFIAERLQAAEAVLPLLLPVEQAKQRRRIAGLKRALTLGTEGLAAAAARAHATRLANKIAKSRLIDR